jgi:hypothetical protein
MREKRIRTRLFRVWLHPIEYEFVTNYAESNMLTAADLIRFWIRQAMEGEGLLKDISIETKPKQGGR